MSEFHVEVVRIGKVEKHANADSLSITMVHGGYPCIIKTGDFAEGDLAVYIPVDALCPVDRAEFKFLDSGKGRAHERVKAKRLRGVFSMGLLVKAPAKAKEGDDLQAHFGIEKWEPPAEREPSTPRTKVQRARWIEVLLGVWIAFLRAIGMAPPKPPVVPVYDIEGLRKFSRVLEDGEEVVLTEKIHGCNARYLHTGKRFYPWSNASTRTLVEFNSRCTARDTSPERWRHEPEDSLATAVG